MRLFPRSFRLNVVLITVLATFIAGSAMGWLHYQTMKRRSQADLNRLLRLSASESATRVAHWLTERRDLAETIASSATLVEELRKIRQLTPRDDEYFLALYRLQRELDRYSLTHPFAHELTIHSPQTGAILVASIAEDVEEFSPETDDRGFAEAQHQVWVSPMFKATRPLPDESHTCTLNVPSMFFAVPIRDGDKLYGVLRLRSHVLDIGDKLLRASDYSGLFTSSDAYIVDDQGLFHSPSHFEHELKSSGRIKDRSMLELESKVPESGQFTHAFQRSLELFEPQIPETQVDLVGYEGIRGRKVVGAWSKVAGADWVCIAEIDHDEAYAPLNELTRTTLYLSLAIGCVVIASSTWLATRLIAPLNQLTTAAIRLASGDRSVRCKLNRDDEIGHLANAFDNMADAVETTLTDVERKAAQLTESNQRLASELTERQRIEQKLREVNMFLDSVIDNIPIMLFMKDANDLRYVRYNKAGRELVGHLAEDVIGKTSFDLYPHDIAENFTAKDREVLNGLKMVEIEEEEIVTRTGIRYLHTKKIPVCDENGKPQILLGISEDITEKKQTLDALKSAKELAESANRAKSDFLANMSHEIRTPMNAIMGMTDLVLDSDLESTQRNYLNIVAESADALLSIINQILDFSKIEAGKLELDEVDFELREEVGDTLKSLGMRAHAKQLELVWQVHSDVPMWLSGDSVRLRQVLINLIGNAIKFTEEGEVFVEVRLEPNQTDRITLHISVRDTGIGIAEGKQQHIFSAFEQADTSTTREYGGTGLGLAITSSIAQAMGGNVWVESALGHGSTFHFTGNFSLGSDQHELTEFPDLQNLPVLVVDDSETNRRILKEILEDWGMSVETAHDAQLAIVALQRSVEHRGSLPLVISDVHMPQMDGFMLTEKIRSLPDLQNTVVILLTSGGRVGDIRRCEKLGISAHLMKPVKQSELLETIVRAIGRQSQELHSGAEFIDESVSIEPMHILLVEDGKANQIVAVGLLTKWGHTVEIAENGEQAIAVWQAGEFDLILMDVQMPILDGLNATARIRELENQSGHRIPIVAMTARAMKGDRDRCLAAGMDEYISKPVRRTELYQVLHNLSYGDRTSEFCSDNREESEQMENTKNENESGPAFDLEAALHNVSGDENLLREVLQMVVLENEKLMPQLDQAIVANDVKLSERLAHTIKGGALSIVASEAASAAKAVENSCSQADFDDAQRLMSVLRQALDKLHTAIAQLS